MLFRWARWNEQSSRAAAEAKQTLQRRNIMSSNLHTKGFYAAMLTVGIVGIGVPMDSAFAYNVSTTVSSPGSNNPFNPLAPTTTGEVGYVDPVMPIIAVGQQTVNCHLLTGYSKGSECR
jgi:hypothetical protein